MMNKSYIIAVLPGDGIGPEIIKQAYKIIDAVCRRFSLNIIMNEYKVGGSAIDSFDTPLPDATLQGCEASDAILFGCVGGPQWATLPIHKQPERGALLKLRKYFNLFANLRHIHSYSSFRLSTLSYKDTTKNEVDILCVRELTGGIYFGNPRGRYGEGSNEYAFDTEIYYRFEIERVAHIAFKLASTRRRHVTSIDKANVLYSSVFWREIVTGVSVNYPDITLSHLYIDAATMHLIHYPWTFDVILCSNLFGDILSDECAAIFGSIGVLPSASLNEKGFGLYEPAGGSAPDIAGKNIANPIAQILSVAMLLRYSLRIDCAADLIENSVNCALSECCTLDLVDYIEHKNVVSTEEMGDIVVKYINY